MHLLLEFRLWLEDEETYNKKFKPRADRAASRLGQHPFQHWFPEGGERVVIPLRTPAISAASHFLQSADYLSPEDKQVVAGLNALGYEVTDYRGGYVRRGQGVEKIGGLLEKLIKFAKTGDERGQYQKWQLVFMNSAARKDKNMDGSENMWVLISRNAHDIAQMSYDREWTSCMELEDGAYKGTPFCVIKTGGMVAYLLRKPQEEVKALAKDVKTYVTGPIARMSIKAAYNTANKDLVIAVPETRVYPQNIKGFYETVFDWVEQHQGDIGSGKFRVLGGYSDDFGGTNKYRVHHRPSRDVDQLMGWLNSHIEVRKRSAIKLALDTQKEYPKAVYEKIKDILMADMKTYGHAGETTENKQLLYIMKKFPEMFTDEDKKNVSYFVKDKADLLSRHDRTVGDFTTKYAHHYDYARNKLIKPEPGDMNKLHHHLSEIGDGKGKFKDDEPFSRLVKYINNTHENLVHLHSRPLNQYMTVNPHKEELQQQADSTAESILTMLSKQHKLADITEHHRNGITHVVTRLISSVLTYSKLTPALVEKSFAVTKKLQSEGSGYMIRYDILIGVDRALRTYADSPDVVSELTKFKAWIDELYPVNAWGNR